MKIKELFDKDIARKIEGVVKASDDEHIFDEVYEYVVTGEIQKNLYRLFEAYNNYDGANGVWISGFFGSGKSHLLKILSYLLEDKKLDNAVSVSEIFVEKIAHEKLLTADIKKAATIPSKSILFNIDEKAVVISKEQIDAVLSVFLQVFNEMLGYHPQADYIAEFERDLDSEGKYDEFKRIYSETSNKTWEMDRKRVHKQRNNVFAKALNILKPKITIEEGLKTLDRYKNDYKISIDDFTSIIKEYIDRQPKGFRLNFFVDEVGQYVAGNTKLMVNLQTIAESLAVKCKGQAWIFVTSQQDVEAVIGDMDSKQGNDFSKIMDRFKNRMPLNSADVSEVIQKRLLDKSDEGKEVLKPLYEREKNNFKTLFEFNDNSRKYSVFKDSSKFYVCYPFIAYQFDLFQAAIMGISRNNGFEGHYRSVGERSMLSVFQEVAKSISDEDTGKLASFDLMFEGLRTSLKGEIQNSIIQAEHGDIRDFHQKVLKALFMIKFVREFKPTLRNIAILMLDRFEMNAKRHEEMVKEALVELEQQTYIQRNGELYEFLTDKEKSIESEIKNTEVDPSEHNSLFGNFIFNSIIRDSKVRYEDNKQDYNFSRKLNDGCFIGREQELAINIITSDYDAFGNDTLLAAKNMGGTEMLVVLEDDSRLYNDMRIYLKTIKYIKQAHSSLSEDDKLLLRAKGAQNDDRTQRFQQRIGELIASAKILINGSLVDVSASDPRTRIIKAFQQLIGTAYPNLKMLTTVYKESDVRAILNDKADDLLKTVKDGIGESEQEILNFINSNKLKAERSTVKLIIAHFAKRPYGWYQAAVQCTLAMLFMKGKIEFKQDSNILERDDLAKHLLNSALFSNLIIDMQEEFDELTVSKLRKFHRDLFHDTNGGTDSKAVAQLFSERLADYSKELVTLLSSKKYYSFLKQLEPIKARMDELVCKDYKYFLKNLDEFEDELLDYAEDIIDPILTFWKGPQRDLYDSVCNYINDYNANFSYLDSAAAIEKLRGISSHPKPYTGAVMREAKILLDKVQGEMKREVAIFIDEAKADILELKTLIQDLKEFKTLSTDKQTLLLRPFVNEEQFIVNEKLIPVIKDKVSRLKTAVYQQTIIQIAEASAPVDTKKDSPDTEPSVKPKIKQSIYSSSIKVKSAKLQLKNESDVEDYIQKLKEEYLKIIQNEKNILID